MSTPHHSEQSGPSTVTGDELILRTEDQQVTFEKLISDTAKYWGIASTKFSTGEAAERTEALRVYGTEWQAAKSFSPHNLHLAYCAAIENTTRRLCATGIWDRSKFPETSSDMINYKALVQPGVGKWYSKKHGSGWRSHVHATFDNDPTVRKVVYWEVDQSEPVVKYLDWDSETGRGALLEF